MFSTRTAMMIRFPREFLPNSKMCIYTPQTHTRLAAQHNLDSVRTRFHGPNDFGESSLLQARLRSFSHPQTWSPDPLSRGNLSTSSALFLKFAPVADIGRDQSHRFWYNSGGLGNVCGTWMERGEKWSLQRPDAHLGLDVEQGQEVVWWAPAQRVQFKPSRIFWLVVVRKWNEYEFLSRIRFVGME
ncbi:hypothetical protein B0H10DRAFT_1947423 [Mycena sp. CBHHK59/15]|nr:hypothetical protein B0H10DRAFT_1947423 [Mycena sp. CBHHK59/15]